MPAPNGNITVKYTVNVPQIDRYVNITINPEEFTHSMNPTILKNKNTGELKDFAKDHSFRPFFTQIGLYNDRGDLLAVIKPAVPIQIPNNVPLTIRARIRK